MPVPGMETAKPWKRSPDAWGVWGSPVKNKRAHLYHTFVELITFNRSRIVHLNLLYVTRGLNIRPPVTESRQTRHGLNIWARWRKESTEIKIIFKKPNSDLMWLQKLSDWWDFVFTPQRSVHGLHSNTPGTFIRHLSMSLQPYSSSMVPL